MTDGLGGADAELLLKGFVDGKQAAVVLVEQGDDVGAVVEDRGKLLFREGQSLLGAFGFRDVDQ